MPSIDEIIQQRLNPFDPVSFATGNFWQEQLDLSPSINSIHERELASIAAVLEQVAKDHRPRTIMLTGDSGSGKSYLLKRLKQEFNSQAFFAYIGPWADSNYIWRHTLRHTVDSLMKVPKYQEDSQLVLWMKSLSAFSDGSLMKRLLGERKQFINDLRATYPLGIYNAKEFFGVLYDLNNPKLKMTAYDWLRGDDLDPDDLKALGVKKAIHSEDAAQNILINFGIISADTNPIVLCFDQLDNIPRLQDNFLDIQALFNVNSSIHNYSPNNLLAIVSIIKNTWKRNSEMVQSADRVRINETVDLKEISLDRAEELWATRLYPLRQQAIPKPASPLYPLTRQQLEAEYPRGRTTPRSVLVLGRQLIGQYKENLVIDVAGPQLTLVKSPVQQDALAAFKLVWKQEFDKTAEKVTRIRDYDGPELIKMLQEALKALEISGIKPKLLSDSATFASYSLSYQDGQNRVGLVWAENPNMSSFFRLMEACQKVIQKKFCQTLYLIRNEGVGQYTHQGNKMYQQIFAGSAHSHIKPDLESLHYLATYHNLVNAACSGELVVANKTPTLQELEVLLRDSQIMSYCPLLQDLGIVTSDGGEAEVDERDKLLREVKDFLLNIVSTQQTIGPEILRQNARSQFPQINKSEIEQLIEQLCQEKYMTIVNPNDPPEQESISGVSQE
ncbi:MAG: ATP-binding protein [Hormoscilla sp. SP5CHS1]|nr:ATP-binding protein [Hormoscilla sp. SP5CHS1]